MHETVDLAPTVGVGATGVSAELQNRRFAALTIPADPRHATLPSGLGGAMPVAAVSDEARA